MTIKELAKVSPQCFIFIRNNDGSVEEYHWPDSRAGGLEIKNVLATSYPMYKNVLEVKVNR